MTDTELQRRKAICEIAGVNDIGELSDGFHTFNSLYEQRMILFAALVRAYKDKAWKSYRHEDGEYCFGGGWFIVGIDTPEGSYTYHYENKYWNMFDCIDLPRAKHWDGHTEADAETRLMSLKPEQWIPCSERLPEEETDVLVTRTFLGCKDYSHGWNNHIPPSTYVEVAQYFNGEWTALSDEYKVARSRHTDPIAWMPLPEPYKEEMESEE